MSKQRQTFRINTEHLIRCLSADFGPSKGDFLTSDMSLEDADLLWLRKSILKKFKDVTHPEATQRAITGFIADNDRCASFEFRPQSWFDDYILGEVKAHLDRWLHDRDGCPATLQDLALKGRCGPGSSVDVDLPTFYTKLFGSTLATTNPQLRRLYAAVISKNPRWFQAEQAREDRYGSRTAKGSKLSTVLKQFDIDRTICTEAPLDMFFQLGIGTWLEDNPLQALGINLSTQPEKNRELARRGSLDGRIATLDAKSASNSIAMRLLELFPRYFADWLRRCRASRTKLPGGSYIDLHMVASMGNGFCFPLQTLLFASVICSVYRLCNIRPDFGSARESGYLSSLHGFDAVNCGVFGDDIIVLTETYHMIVRALELLGFIINRDKSFSTGDFRESCGHDYFRGVNIRGVYLKTMASRGNCYSLINRLVRWSCRTSIPLDFTVSYLLSTIGFTPVPFTEDDSAGVKVPFTYSGREWYSLTGGRLYYATHYRPVRIKPPQSLDDEPVFRDTVVGFNPDGLVISFLGGYIRDGYITLRDGSEEDEDLSSREPEVLLRETPNWRYIPKAVSEFDLRGKSWEACADRVLGLTFTRFRPE